MQYLLKLRLEDFMKGTHRVVIDGTIQMVESLHAILRFKAVGNKRVVENPLYQHPVNKITCQSFFSIFLYAIKKNPFYFKLFFECVLNFIIQTNCQSTDTLNNQNSLGSY